MSVCAVMLVRDEADIIETTVRHLLTQVDHILLADNMSTDGTREILDRISAEDERLEVHDDWEVAYYQSRKTTDLAGHVFRRGFDWVLPVDADEIWYASDLRSISEFLDGVVPDIQVLEASLYNHLPSAEDPAPVVVREYVEEIHGHGIVAEVAAERVETLDPVQRIGWRQREHQALGKVCCRARPDLTIGAGNHAATTKGTALTGRGLVIRHFSWRSPEQYVRKIRNGIVAYAATNLPETTGEHWRMWQTVYERNGTSLEDIRSNPGLPLPGDGAVGEHFARWFFSERPREDRTLIYDPAPVSR